MSADEEPTVCDSQVFSAIGAKMYLTEENADVHFVFESNGESERIPAHKILLSSANDVFEAMFYGPLKEPSDIKIVDVSAEVFKAFLRFFYFNEVKLTIENVADVMYLAKKYDVTECLKVCAGFLTNKITVDNVISVLGLSIVYDQAQLQELCESEIRENAKEILQSSIFLECDRQVLNHIVKMDFLSCSESEVFEACMSWVRAVSKQNELTRDMVQTHLGNVFYEIRFGSMSLDEFIKLLPMYGNLFSGAEYNEILQTISQLETEPKLFKGFRYSWNDNKVIKCERTVSYLREEKYFIQRFETTTFSTDTPLLLGYFVCSPLYNRNNSGWGKNLPVIATIVSDATHTEAQFLNCLFNDIGAHVKLSRPILIKPKIKYEIRLSFPEDQYYAIRELKSIVELEPNVTMQFHNDPMANGKIRGIIYELGFNLL